MSKTFLFIGASSDIARAAFATFKCENHRIIGISRNPSSEDFDDFYTVEKYDTEHLPEIEEVIDGLVYFPGSIVLKSFSQLKKEDYINDLEINTLGAVMSIQKYLPNLKKSANPSIVLISSVATHIGLPFHCSISLAKAGLEGFAKALSAELAPKVRVNIVSPSLTDTKLASKLLNTPEKIEQAQKRNPLQKVGSPEDISNVICFLLSDKSLWITGQNINIDGGMAAIK
jgi:NAD(P)-dependent dehydrogenase (short-subunit alcohol dehydrogenase family)